MKTTTTIETLTGPVTVTRLQKGSRAAEVQPQNGRWVAWVGLAHPSGETYAPARWFKGGSTCSNSYATEAAALKAVEAYLNARGAR